MTRVGRKIINLPEGTSIVSSDEELVVVGPKGRLSVKLDAAVDFVIESGSIVVKNVDGSKAASAKHGLYRALISNMVKGVNEGFAKDLELVGVGYRVALQETSLHFSLGYSHPVIFSPPAGILFTVEGQNKIKVSGIDKQMVGQTTAEIIKLRPPDSYKGKGIRIAGTVIKTKPGKSVKK